MTREARAPARSPRELLDGDRAALAESLLALAQAAGERVMEIYRQDFDVETKGDGSPLTEADRRSNACIVEGLAGLTPGVPVLSEESAAVPYRERRSWQRYWLVDPLDGTKEFVRRNGEFTVNIALMEEDHPVMGAVCAPAIERCYLGVRGAGAWRAERGRSLVPIRARSYTGGRATVIASRSHVRPEVATFIARLEEREGKCETVNMGSSLKICLVAEGRADVYPRLGPTSEWDVAAAHSVVEAAGGRLTRVGGAPLLYNKESPLNPAFVVTGGADYDWWTLFHGLDTAPG